MTADDRFRELMRLAGIEPHYWDIQGNYYETSPDTGRVLLSALGFPCEDETAVGISLSDLKERDWRSALPPVVVARSGQDQLTTLRLPSTDDIGRLHVWVQLEHQDTWRELNATVTESGESALVDSVAMRSYGLNLKDSLSCGYHTLRIEVGSTEATAALIMTPERCYLPSGMAEGERYFGLSAQLYTLFSESSWGVGDFTDLSAAVDWAADLGAATLALNPLHALFPSEPNNASPYSPNSRLFLNPIYLDVTEIDDLSESAEAQRLISSKHFADTIEAVRSSRLVDYEAVVRMKFAALEALHRSFRQKHMDTPDDPRADHFRNFRSDNGRSLRRFAIFQAATEHFGTHDWSRWPLEMRNPRAEELDRFTASHEERVAFFEYLQWQSDLQLEAAGARAAPREMEVGLYRDLAISVESRSADAWGNQDLFVQDARIGAPPDPFNAHGQEWGVVPMHPDKLREMAYAPYIDLLRANMRHAGALRIDHVMGLQHLFWVPAGRLPSEGAYVHYPMEDLLGILALESHRNKCLIVGEDLGTVPPGFRERMAASNILSYHVLYFERDDHHFRPPEAYRSNGAACISTHDLATVTSYWDGTDVAMRAELGLYTSEEQHAEELRRRENDKKLLCEALREANLPPNQFDVDGQLPERMTDELFAAIHRYLARSNAALFLVEVDDLCREEAPVNLPGTTSQYPNWRRKLSRSVSALQRDPEIARLASSFFAEGRSRGAKPFPPVKA